jgi:hypothetical protein
MAWRVLNSGVKHVRTFEKVDDQESYCTGYSGRSFSVLILQVAFQGSICKKDEPRQSEQPNIAGHVEESEYPGGEPDSQRIGAAYEFQGNPARRNRLVLWISRVNRSGDYLVSS